MRVSPEGIFALGSSRKGEKFSCLLKLERQLKFAPTNDASVSPGCGDRNTIQVRSESSLARSYAQEHL